MIDVAGLPATGLSAADFELSVGGWTSWSGAPALTAVTVRRGAGGLRHRPRHAPLRRRRHPQHLAPRQGPGHRPDRPGPPRRLLLRQPRRRDRRPPRTFKVNAYDLAATLRATRRPSTVTGRYDTNRDGRIDALDVTAVRSNLNRTLPPNIAAPAAASPPASTRARSTYRGATRDLFQDAAPDRVGGRRGPWVVRRGEAPGPE
jgi:hypothetical protein